MASTTAQTQNSPAIAAVLQILSGVHVAGVVSCIARLGIPDLVEAGPKSAEELAKQIGAQPRALYRLMRAAASVGILAESADGKFSETPMSALLRTNGSPSLRGYAIMSGREWHGMGWSRIEHSVRTGERALDAVYGMPLWDYFEQHPEEAKIFNDAMTGLSMIDGPAVAAAYSFQGINSVVDVGGGHGALLAEILKRNPALNGILYDMPHVVAGAKDGPLKPLLTPSTTTTAARCTIAGGDMFSSVPAGADAYIMKHIIHDWPDDACIKILKACRAAVNPGGKLLVVDSVIQPGNEFSPSKFLDLQMLIFPGGCERTEKQFRELLAAAGWQLTRVIPTAALDSIVEGVPA